jgi:hypothetical protein
MRGYIEARASAPDNRFDAKRATKRKLGMVWGMMALRIAGTML